VSDELDRPDSPAPPAGSGTSPDPVPGHRPSGSITQPPPSYKGEPLDGERGPGLGCFWVQVVLLGTLLVITPLTVAWAWDPAISAGLLILTLLLLLFAGNTVIFLLRLVAADRRTRRRPLSETARKTVGQLEEEAAAAEPSPPSEDPPIQVR
jgi:hypothetical protein